jgi:hypothetical protein
MKKNTRQGLVPIKIRKGSLLSIIRSTYKDEGLYHLICTIPKYLFDICFNRIPNYVAFLYYSWSKISETFEFQGITYHYLFHPYCSTWKNERCVVIPIAWQKVLEYQAQGSNILEIGNMMSYVYKTAHDVLDKYEIIDGVINEDIADFHPTSKYDFIFSLMTLQYVGWYESPREPMKIVRVMENLKNILAPNGIIMVIHGLGQNKVMDELLTNGTLRFNKKFYLKRISGYKWEEADWESVKETKYDYSIPTANGLVIGYIGIETKA